MNEPSDSGIRKAVLHGGPEPWAAHVTVYWEIYARDWGRRRRWRRLRKVLGDLDLSDYQHREDMVMDSTIIYFRNKQDAVSAYFYFS